MSHREKLEQVMDLLINEEHEAAEELLHQVMVEKAREAYENLVEEDFGGDMKDDFADDIEADVDEIEADEVFDDEGMDDEEMEVDLDDEGEEVEDRVEDLEAALADLRAEFDALMGGDEVLGDEYDDAEMDMDMEVDMDMDMDMEELEDDGLEEATKLQDPVADPGMSKEGKLAGTGAKSKSGATGTESPYTRMKPRTTEGEPTDFVGKDEAGMKAGKGKDHTPSDNVRENPKATGHSKDSQKQEGKPAGTGKNTKAGAVNTKSALGQSGSPRGNK